MEEKEFRTKLKKYNKNQLFETIVSYWKMKKEDIKSYVELQSQLNKEHDRKIEAQKDLQNALVKLNKELEIKEKFKQQLKTWEISCKDKDISLKYKQANLARSKAYGYVLEFLDELEKSLIESSDSNE
jgi:hypothetical protein